MVQKLALVLAAIVLLAGGVYIYAHHNWNPLQAGTEIDRILVEKSARKLSIFADGKKLKSYRVALGHNPVGAKEQEGDMKTPEGFYWIDWRNPESDYHLSLHVSYPSDEDNARAAEREVNAGFDIMDRRLHRVDRRRDRRTLPRHARLDADRDSTVVFCERIRLPMRAWVRGRPDLGQGARRSHSFRPKLRRLARDIRRQR